MALEPFRRKIGAPAAAPLTRVQQVGIPDVGPEIARAGQQIFAALEPTMKKQAQEAALNDFAAQGIQQEPDGTLTLPKPQGGGEIYKATFNEAALQAYQIRSFNETQIKIQSLYNATTEEELVRSPDDLLATGVAMIQGVVEKADPKIKNALLSDLWRELQQRHNAFTNGEHRKAEEIIKRTLERDVENNLNKAFEYAALPQVDEEKGRLAALNFYDQAAQQLSRLVNLNFADPKSLNQMQEGFDKWWAGAGIIRKLNEKVKMQAATSSEVQTIIDIVSLSDLTSEVDGIDAKWVVESTSPEHRPTLLTRLRSIQAKLERQEKDEGNENIYNEILDSVGTGGDKPLGMGEKKWLDVVTKWASDNGLDPYTPTGFFQMTKRFSVASIPNEIYKDFFANLSSRSRDYIDRAAAVAEAMENAVDDKGDSIPDLRTEFMDTDTLVFLENYNRGVRFGETDPIAFARSTVREDRPDTLKEAVDAITRVLPEGAKYQETFKGYIKGLDYSALGAEDLNELQIFAGNLVAQNIPLEKAVSIASSRLANRRTLVAPNSDTLLLEPQLRVTQVFGDTIERRTGLYIRKAETPPTVTSKTGERSREYVQPYVDLAIQKLAGGEQLAGVPVKAKLKAGKNVFIKHYAGGTDPKSRLFSVWYYDEKTGSTSLIRRKDNAPLIIDLGQASSIQERESGKFRRAYAESKNEGERLAKQAFQYYIPGSQGFLELLGLEGQGQKLRFGVKNQKALAEFEAWQKTHTAQFGHEPSTVRDKKKKYVDRGLPVAPSVEHMQLPVVREQMIQNSSATGRKPSQVVREVATQLGIKPHELVSILLVESEANPSTVNTLGYVGLFQASPTVQKALNITKNDTFESQLPKLISYLEGKGQGLGHTGYKKGMGWQKVLAAIFAGNVNANPNVSDKYGTTLKGHWKNASDRFQEAEAWLERN